MESLVGKKILVTGHTGFKGAWLSLLLHHLGAKVYGIALAPPTTPSLFSLLRLDQKIDHAIVDIRSKEEVMNAVDRIEPEIVFHGAAQSNVLQSYEDPIDTFQVNAMGTLHLLSALHQVESCTAAIIMTTDKCYRFPNSSINGFSEEAPLGGNDPYSASKACAELAVHSYRHSFLKQTDLKIATVRSGNVIGGGDWAKNRILPDAIRCLMKNSPLVLRYPHARRPWIHVLETLFGYITLALRIQSQPELQGAWNFGSTQADAITVKELASMFYSYFPSAPPIIESMGARHEETNLILDCRKAKDQLGFAPFFSADDRLQLIAEWTRAYIQGKSIEEISINQIRKAFQILTNAYTFFDSQLL